MVISVGIPAVPRNRNSRNSVPNPSAEEKTTRNSVPLNKKRSELSEFPSEHFSGRENNSESLSVDTKIEEYSQNFLQRKTKQHGIPFRGKNIEANCRNSVPNHSAKEKPAQHKIWQPKISIIVFDVGVIIEAVRCEFRKTSFFRGIPFRSVPFRASELALPRNSECLGMSTFFRGITEIIPSLFCGIFSERNSDRRHLLVAL